MDQKADSITVVGKLRTMAPTISVGVLAADLMSLGTELGTIAKSGVGILHFDVMDGCFCPMLTAGPPFIKAVKTDLVKDVHLMIDNPMDKIESYVSAGADVVTVHVEACRHPHRVLQALGQMKNANDPGRGICRGAAINPGTPLEALEPLLEEVEMVVLLAVNPGWSGQKFIRSAARRMERLLDMIRRSGRDVLTCLDGGITRDNVVDAVRAGADIVVTGSAVFDGKDPARNARAMLDSIAEWRKLR